MTPIAHTLLYASHYAHGRSLTPHRKVIAAARLLWPQIDPESRADLLRLWRDQIPTDLDRMIEAQGTSIVPTSARELREELAAWLRLFDDLERER